VLHQLGAARCVREAVGQRRALRANARNYSGKTRKTPK